MYESERKELVKILMNRGITDTAVLKAFDKVERHQFVSPGMLYHAYKDKALPIGKGQTISQPYTVAFMTQALKLKPGSKVLEVGTGSGYQAAILHSMGMSVFSIERNFELYTDVVKLFEKLRIRVFVRCGDGTIGWNEYAPFDGILVTAGSPVVPVSLKKQLAIGGRLIIPVGDRKVQAMNIITRVSETDFNVEEVPDFGFVPLIGREGWNDKN